MADTEREIGTVWYQKIDGEGVDGIEGEYELDSKGGELIVTVYPRSEEHLGNGTSKILFPWRRVLRIDGATTTVRPDARTTENLTGDI